MSVGDGLRVFMIVVGLVILGMTVMSLARKHMTESFCIAWGFAAALFICAGIIVQPTQWNQYVSWGALLLILFGVVLLLAGAFIFSVRVSTLSRQVKELAILVSLLNQENANMLREFAEDQKESETAEHEEEALVRH